MATARLSAGAQGPLDEEQRRRIGDLLETGGEAGVVLGDHLGPLGRELRQPLFQLIPIPETDNGLGHGRGDALDGHQVLKRGLKDRGGAAEALEQALPQDYPHPGDAPEAQPGEFVGHGAFTVQPYRMRTFPVSWTSRLVPFLFDLAVEHKEKANQNVNF